MKMFFVGLALGVGIGFLLLPKSSDEHDQLIRERTRELQRSLPKTQERALQSAAIQERDHFSHPRRPAYISRAGAIRAGIHPMVALNTAPEKELVSFYGVSPEEAARIVAARPFTSIQDARDRAGLSEEALADIRQGAQAKEPQPIQPTA